MVDIDRQKPVMITTPAGERYIPENGRDVMMVIPADSPLHCRGENM